MKVSEATQVFITAYCELSELGYDEEIMWVARLLDGRKKIDEDLFFEEYAYVVLNAGMREQTARKIYQRFIEGGRDCNVVNHLGKRKALVEGLANYKHWYKELQEQKTADDKIEYLETLPFIGKITKYHLARNIGIDAVKPDRWLERMAKRYNHSSPKDMCIEIQKEIGMSEPLGVIDVVLWRWCNLGKWNDSDQ